MNTGKFLVIVALSLLSEIGWALWVQTLVNNQVPACLALTFSLPWVNYAVFLWFCDAKGKWDRILQTLAASVGSTLGIWIVLSWF